MLCCAVESRISLGSPAGFSDLLRPELDKSRGVEAIIMFGRVFGRSKPVPSTLSTLDKLNEVSSLVPPVFYSSLFKVTRISVLDSSDRNGSGFCLSGHM